MLTTDTGGAVPVVAAPFAVFSLGVVVAACGQGGMLVGLGNRSRDAEYEGLTTTTEVVAGHDEDLDVVDPADAWEVAWYNDDIEDQVVGATQLTGGSARDGSAHDGRWRRLSLPVM